MSEFSTLSDRVLRVGRVEIRTGQGGMPVFGDISFIFKELKILPRPDVA